MLSPRNVGCRYKPGTVGTEAEATRGALAQKADYDGINLLGRGPCMIIFVINKSDNDLKCVKKTEERGYFFTNPVDIPKNLSLSFICGTSVVRNMRNEGSVIFQDFVGVPHIYWNGVGYLVRIRKPVEVVVCV
eukprot:TRINITY_DN14940_c0_g1_i1.p1 TRINITY_DN14940_c0_g1~~TRINITY_DN14940_c0_g1_i1.p1  ORF type:complete len:133 (+),score=14.68 TRINITY_DN14940_c0_g1_i1:226-624(+)